MIAPKPHVREEERLKELKSYHILDTLSESDYNDITTLAAGICGTKISLISLIDENRQWFKSCYGIEASETPRAVSFCGHAINSSDNIFIVNDARKDERFHDNPLVTEEPNVVFYAGVSLRTKNDLPLGTLCVLDNEPKELNQNQKDSLAILSKQIMNVLALRKKEITLKDTLQELEIKNRELARFSSAAAHDLKSPLASIKGLSNLLLDQYKSKIGEDGTQMLELIEKSSSNLMNLIDGLLDYSTTKNIQNNDKEEIDLSNLLDLICNLHSTSTSLNLTKKITIDKVIANKAVLNQVFLNLIVNAIKYNDKETIELEVGAHNTDTHYEFYVQDNGPGIPEKEHENIFTAFNILSEKDRFGNRGTGIGLASVKKVVESCGGTISVQSSKEKGTRFDFTIQK